MSLAEAAKRPRVVEARASDPAGVVEHPGSGESDLLIGQTIDGRYRIDVRIGEGGLGSVYKAHHLKLGRSVAVKVLRSELRSVPEIRQRFEREVRTLSSLSHPNIVTITDYGDERGMPYLVMELAEGKELNVLAKEGMEPRRALEVTRQILSSLSYAHARDVVHRDLKPANVIVCPMPEGRDHAVVLDFGLAKFMGDDGSGHDLTRSGLVVGTPAYLPPEQLGGGSKKADARSDLYAVGLICFEMLTGRRPFLGDDAADVLRAHLVSTPPTLAEACPGATVSAPLEKLIAKALEKAPADRYQSASAMLAALDALPIVPMRRPGLGRDETDRIPSSIEVDVHISRPAQPARPPGRSMWRWGVLAALFVIGGSFALGARWGAGSTEETASVVPTAPTITELAGAVTTARDTVASGVASGVEAVAAALPTSVDVLTPHEGEELVDGEVVEEIAPGEEVTSEEAMPDAEDGELLADPTSEAVVAFEVPTDRPRARNPWNGRVPALLARLHRTVGRRELSRLELRQATRYRNEHAQDPRARLLLGHAFARRGWLTAALDQYERALALDLGARGDPDLIATVIRIARSESLTARASSIMIAAYGAEASVPLTRAIEREHDPAARGRLEALRARLPAE